MEIGKPYGRAGDLDETGEPTYVDTMSPVHVLVVVSAAALSAGAALTWSHVGYRLAVPARSPTRRTCGRCGRPFLEGWCGWLHLGCSCRACPGEDAAPWWAVSGLAGSAAGALAWRLPTGRPAEIVLLLTWLVVVQVGVLLSVIDLAVRRLPTPLVTAAAVAAGVGIAAAVLLAHRPRWIIASAISAAIIGGGYLLLALLTPSQVGMGDVRLAGVLGALLGVDGWTTLLLGAVLPYLIALPFAVAQVRRPAPASRRQVPFGPFLIVGAIIAAIVAP